MPCPRPSCAGPTWRRFTVAPTRAARGRAIREPGPGAPLGREAGHHGLGRRLGIARLVGLLGPGELVEVGVLAGQALPHRDAVDLLAEPVRHRPARAVARLVASLHRRRDASPREHLDPGHQAARRARRHRAMLGEVAGSVGLQEQPAPRSAPRIDVSVRAHAPRNRCAAAHQVEVGRHRVDDPAIGTRIDRELEERLVDELARRDSRTRRCSCRR